MIMMDPPAHHHMRTLVNRVFTPRAMAELEPMVRVGDRLLPRRCSLAGSSSTQSTEFAGPFPVEVISSMLGIPAADRQRSATRST